MKNLYTEEDVMKKTGLSWLRIQFYSAHGLIISCPERGQRRVFLKDMVARIAIISELIRYEMKIETIRNILDYTEESIWPLALSDLGGNCHAYILFSPGAEDELASDDRLKGLASNVDSSMVSTAILGFASMHKSFICIDLKKIISDL